MRREQVNANAEDLDILQGTQIYRTPAGGAQISLAAIQINGNPGDLTLDLFIGDYQAIENAVLNPQQGTKTNAPRIPDDLIMDDEPAGGGEFIYLNIRNTTGTNLSAFYRLNVEPL